MTKIWPLAIILAVTLCCGCVKVTDATMGAPPPAEPLKPEPTPRLMGRVSGDTYVSARGKFAVVFPVSRDYGGRISHDDEESVTFTDRLANRISFYSKQFTSLSPMAAALQKEGVEKALTTFLKDNYGGTFTTHFHQARGGIVSFVLVKPLSTRTGVATMVHQNRIYLVETDLPPGVQFLSKQDDMSALDDKLEAYAVNLLQSLEVH